LWVVREPFTDGVEPITCTPGLSRMMNRLMLRDAVGRPCNWFRSTTLAKLEDVVSSVAAFALTSMAASCRATVSWAA